MTRECTLVDGEDLRPRWAHCCLCAWGMARSATLRLNEPQRLHLPDWRLLVLKTHGEPLPDWQTARATAQASLDDSFFVRVEVKKGWLGEPIRRDGRTRL